MGSDDSGFDGLGIAESVKSKKDIFMASKLVLGGALKSKEASNVIILPI